jgi:hypothetical protein
MPRCRTSIVALLALLPPAGPARADTCDTVKSAILKINEVPSYHTTTLMEGKGQQNVMEGIFLNDMAYVKPNPAVGWMSMPITREDRQKNFGQGAFKHPIHDCRAEGKEPVGGVPTQVYSYLQDHEPNAQAPKGTEPVQTKTRVWIGDKDGLVRKLDTDFVGKGRLLITVDYENVKPPAPGEMMHR